MSRAVIQLDASGQDPLELQTEERGSFYLTGQQPAVYRWSATTPGRRTAPSPPLDLTAGGRWTTSGIELFPTVTLQGTLTGDGLPTKIEAAGEQAAVGDDGSFELQCLADTHWFAAHGPAQHKLWLRATAPAALEIALPAAQTVQVHCQVPAPAAKQLWIAARSRGSATAGVAAWTSGSGQQVKLQEGAADVTLSLRVGEESRDRRGG